MFVLDSVNAVDFVDAEDTIKPTVSERVGLRELFELVDSIGFWGLLLSEADHDRHLAKLPYLADTVIELMC
jgi:hypothetical protein